MKCAECKSINAKAESLRHPNQTTILTSNILTKKAKELRSKKDPNHFCSVHLQGEVEVLAPYTSAASTEFIAGWTKKKQLVDSKKAIIAETGVVSDEMVDAYRALRKLNVRVQ